jgi:S-adenosylmethionine-diacylglycerol 3-amino-3-carboxypropyl transferase
MSSEAAQRADFSRIRYAQCWEDADVLLPGLAVREGDVCLSIASAGDNSLSLLTARPARVIAIDLSPAQLACVALRVAAYRCLEHGELLELMGSRESDRRAALYQRCRRDLDDDARAFWNASAPLIDAGIGSAGKFERYFRLFRRWALPLVHGRRDVRDLLAGGDAAQRQAFYQQRWNTWRWRMLFGVFFSRFVMGRLGRDPEFFRYVQGSVADRILERTHHALTALNPADNPYLHWILTGTHGAALPHALRPEHFDTIRNHVDRLTWRRAALEDVLREPDVVIDRFNLSDVFEYMSPQGTAAVLRQCVARSRPGGRLAYWNMLAPRSAGPELADRLEPLHDLAQGLHQQDKAFFYSRFVVEQVRG